MILSASELEHIAELVHVGLFETRQQLSALGERKTDLELSVPLLEAANIPRESISLLEMERAVEDSMRLAKDSFELSYELGEFNPFQSTKASLVALVSEHRDELTRPKQELTAEHGLAAATLLQQYASIELLILRLQSAEFHARIVNQPSKALELLNLARKDATEIFGESNRLIAAIDEEIRFVTM